MTREDFARATGVVAAFAFMFLLPNAAWAADGIQTGMLIAYASLGLAGLVGIIGGIWWSWDLRRHPDAEHREQRVVFPQPSPKTVERKPTPTPNTGEFRVEPAESRRQMQVVLRAVQGDAERSCPKCERSFPQGVMVCPIDATPLEPIRRAARVERPTPVGDQPVCVACGRVYEKGAQFCYHDGQKLAQVPLHAAVTFHVCKTCGWETDVPTEVCPHDGEPLTLLDPDQRESLVPTIPMMTCRECGHVAGPAETRCPQDGQMLYPVTNVRLHALPTGGIGPRRKVCTTCGATYSRAGNYCVHDGEKLTPLN